MPRLSLYSPTKGNNYKYIDRVVKEQFQIGGTDLLVHKYLGPQNNGESSDLTQPQNTSPNPLAIQDLLFMENRNRVYEQDIYRLRGHYNVQNLDFDLSQFGLFLTNDVIFITVHYNDMIDLIGRKLMVGDVFELPHLTDYHPLNEAIPVSLRRYYQITDANYASEGFSQTWYPHLWRIKCEPLVDSQEFANILTAPVEKDNYMGNWDPLIAYPVGYTVQYGGKNYTPVKGPVPVGIEPTNTEWWRVDVASSLKDIISTYNKNLEVNDAILAEAARMVPNTGFDNSQLYLVPSTTSGTPDIPVDIVTNRSAGPALPIREGTGTVALFNSKRFKNGSVGIKVGRETAGKLASGNRVVFATGTLRADRSDTGSGRTFGSQVLTATIYTDSLKTGPYGTADNTYATSDLYLRFYITASQNSAKTTIIKLLEWNNDLDTGLLIKGSVLTANGTLISLFADGTRITAIDKTKKTITVSNELLAEIAAGQELEISYDFYGIYQSVTTFATKQGAKRFKLMTYTSNLKEGTEIRSFVDVSGTRTRVFAAGTTVTKIETVSELVISSSSVVVPDTYNDWSNTSNYYKGDVVKLGDKYYQALTDITGPRRFISSVVSTTKIGNISAGSNTITINMGGGDIVTGMIVTGDGIPDNNKPNGISLNRGNNLPSTGTIGEYFLQTAHVDQTTYIRDNGVWRVMTGADITTIGRPNDVATLSGILSQLNSYLPPNSDSNFVFFTNTGINNDAGNLYIRDNNSWRLVGANDYLANGAIKPRYKGNTLPSTATDNSYYYLTVEISEQLYQWNGSNWVADNTDYTTRVTAVTSDGNNPATWTVTISNSVTDAVTNGNFNFNIGAEWQLLPALNLNDYPFWKERSSYTEGDVVKRLFRGTYVYYRALNDITVASGSTYGFYASDWERLEVRPLFGNEVYEDFVYMETSTPSLVSVVDETVVEFDFGDGKVVDNRIDFRADADPRFQYIRRASPRNFGYLAGYGSGDGSAPNGEPAGSGIEFPVAPKVGDFFLRTDYAPQQLYRWDGQLWIKISEKVRVAPGFASEGTNQKSNFVNNTGTVTLADGSTIPSRQGLSNALKQ